MPEIIIETTDGVEDSGTVEQRFSHPHEHDVGGTSIHRLSHAEHLIHDFVGAQGPLQTILSRRTEAAGHWATHLAGDTNGEALIRGDADGLNGFAVLGGQQQLGGGIGRHRSVHLPQTADLNTLFLQAGPPRLGKHRDLVQRTSSLGVQPIVELPSTEGLLPLGHRPVL